MSMKIEEAKTTFASLMTKRPRFYTCEGSRERNDYEIKIDKKGHKTLECVGSHDIYEEIQSYAEEVRIENIIARAAAGDYEALNKRQGFYADITDSPRDLADAQNAILKLSNEFDKLPAEIRANFDNSKEMFVSLYGTEQFNEKMGWNEKAEIAPEQTFIPESDNLGNKILTPEGGNE